jgi:hypothetical protein
MPQWHAQNALQLYKYLEVEIQVDHEPSHKSTLCHNCNNLTPNLMIMKLFSVLAGLLSLTAASPLPQVPAGANIITPVVSSQYDVSTGEIVYDTGLGLICKATGNSDVTTLFTFNVTAAACGKTGVFGFALDNAATTTVSGNQLLDLFSSLNPATASEDSWPPGNQRDNHLGRLNVVQDGAATWVDGFPVAGQGFTISAAGTYGYELVGVGDADLVSYASANNGIWISWS